MIKKIISENFMGAVGRVITDVSKFTAFVGDNGAGKTTRLTSVIVTLQGFISDKFGRKPVRTMKMARADEMITGVELDNGKRYERTFLRKGKSVSSATRIDGESVPAREGGGIIENDLGNFPVMFDLGKFQDDTPEKKKEFLFSITDAITDISDKAAFFGLLKYELMKQLIDEVTPDRLLEFKYEVDGFENLPVGKHDEFFDVLNGQIDPEISDYIETLIVSFGERFTSAPQVLFDTLSKIMAEEVSYMKKVVRDTDTTRTNLAEASAKLDGKQQELETIKTDVEESGKKRDSLIKRISKNEANILRVSDHDNLLQKMKEKIEGDSSFLDEYADLSPLTDAMDKLKADLESALQVRATDKESLAALKESSYTKSGDYRVLVEKKSSKLELIASLESIDGYCVVSKLVKCTEDFTVPLAEAKQTVADLVDEMVPMKAEIDKLSTDIRVLEATLKSSNIFISDMENVLGDKKQEFAVIEEKRSGIISALDANKAELVEIESREVPKVLDSDILEGELTAVKTKLVILDDRRMAINRAEATYNALNGELLKAKSSSDKLMAAAGLKKTIQALRNQLLDTAVQPLVKSITVLMQKVDPTFSVRFNLENGFDVDVLRNDEWQSFDSLSGGETMVFAIALLTSIIETANPPLKVLALEAAELDKKNLAVVLETLPIIADNIDNVFLAYPDGAVADVDGWDINRL